MKRFIYLVLVVAFIVALPVSHLVMASGPPGSRVCHNRVVRPAPSAQAVAAHLNHGDCEVSAPLHFGCGCQDPEPGPIPGN
jgi:hypothetical protein